MTHLWLFFMVDISCVDNVTRVTRPKSAKLHIIYSTMSNICRNGTFRKQLLQDHKLANYLSLE